jgi:ketosteroid isomerase-like protein
MSIKPIADVFAEVFESFDAGDISKLSGYVTDDVRLRLGNTPLMGGRAEFVDAVSGFLASVAAVHHEILHVFEDHDIAVVEFDVHYTRHDGGVVVLPCCNVFRMREGLIAEYRSYMDATPVYAER